MSDDLRAYLASQNAAVPGSPDPDESDPDADEATTGDETETPVDALPGDDEPEIAASDTAEAEETDEVAAESTAGPETHSPAESPEAVQAATARAEAAEQREAETRQALNNLWAQQAFQQLQERWAGMDPEEAEADKARLVAQIAGRREQALHTENQHLRATIQQDWDLRENKPRAIAHITKKYTLTPDEAALIADEDDPELMDRFAAKLQQRRETLTKAARAKARQDRIATGADRVGGQAGGARGAKPASTGNELRDYLLQQKAALR